MGGNSKKVSKKEEVGLKICQILAESKLSVGESISILRQVRTNILSHSVCSSPKEFNFYPYDYDLEL